MGFGEGGMIDEITAMQYPDRFLALRNALLRDIVMCDHVHVVVMVGTVAAV